VAISADDAAGLTGFSSGQVSLLGQAMMPIILALLALKSLLNSGIASYSGLSLGWQEFLNFCIGIVAYIS
jgi:hypothetical protein